MKRIFCMLFCVAVFLSSYLPAGYAEAEKWYEPLVKRWEENGYFDGDGEKGAPMDAPITRGEFVFLIHKFAPRAAETAVNFTDVQEGDWYYEAFTAAVSAGIVTGYGDWSVRPAQSITREEAAVIAARAFGISERQYGANYPDFQDISYWAKGSVNGLSGRGGISGYGDGTFGAARNISRAEAISLIDRAGSLKTVSLGFNDCPIGKNVKDWYVKDTANVQILEETPGDRILKINKDTAAPRFDMWTYFPQMTGTVTVDFRMKTDELGGTKMLYFRDDVAMMEYAGEEGSAGVGIQNDQLVLVCNQTLRPVKSVKPGTWYGIQLLIDTDEDKADLYVDGIGVARDMPLRTLLHNVGNASVSILAGATGTLYIDGLQLYNSERTYFAVEAEARASEEMELSSQTAGAAPAGPQWSLSGDEKSVLVQVENGENYLSLQVAQGENGAGASYNFQQNLAGNVDIRFQIRRSNVVGENDVIFADHRIILAMVDEDLYYKNLANQLILITGGMRQQVWHDIRIIAKCDYNTFDIEVNGQPMGKDLPFRAAATAINNVILPLTAPSYGTVDIRNMTLEVLDTLPVEKQEPLAGYALGKDAPELGSWQEEYAREPAGIVVEAEKMELRNFTKDERGQASGKAVIIAGSGGGTAAFEFTGESGFYSIDAGYWETSTEPYDASYRIYHNGEELDYWCGQFDDTQRHVRRVKDSWYVEKGDPFILEGSCGKDAAIFDYISFGPEIRPRNTSNTILADDIFHFYGGTARSAWETGGSGGTARLFWSNGRSLDIFDSSTSDAQWAKRRFSRQDGGKVEFRVRIHSNQISDGIRFAVRGGDTEAAAVTVQDKKLYYVKNDGTQEYLGEFPENTKFWMNMTVDLDTRQVQAGINGNQKQLSGLPLSGVCASVDNFYVETGETGKSHIGISYLKIYTDFYANEGFFDTLDGDTPYGWILRQEGGDIRVRDVYAYTEFDCRSLVLSKTKEGAVAAKKEFPEAHGIVNLVFDMQLPKYSDSLEASLTTGETPVLRLANENGNLCCRGADGQPVTVWNGYLDNLWYRIKMQVDTQNHTADIYVNHMRMVQNIPISSDIQFVDGVQFSLPGMGTVNIDTVEVTGGKYECVVPAPEPARIQGDYIVATQACDLWREGRHFGWDSIRPYDNRTPLLGYYEDGDPEVADWQIKWMLEHGISAYLSCWYRPNTGAPFRESENNFALENGFMEAEYFNQMKFGILFENGAGVSSIEDFTENVVRYWIEHYFKNPSYLLIDNQPVVSIWRATKMLEDLGSEAAVREALERAEEAVREAGFDGVIWITVSTTDSPQEQASLKAMGYDYIYGYGYGAATVEEQLKIMQRAQETGNIDFIPSVSQGWGAEAWGLHDRKMNTTLNEWRTGLAWLKEQYMPKYQPDSLASKLILVGNWNEIGEGHFLIPSKISGFGYLDEIKRAFAEDGDAQHHDLIPEELGLGPYDRLYPGLW